MDATDCYSDTTHVARGVIQDQCPPVLGAMSGGSGGAGGRPAFVSDS